MPNTTGPWKEDRQGGASLCYLLPSEEELTWISQHHQEVGIRATIICRPEYPSLAGLAERNWDLALPANIASLGSLKKLTEWDGRTERGLYLAGNDHILPPGWEPLYQICRHPGKIPPPPEPRDLLQLPSFAPPSGKSLAEAIEAVVQTGAWAIWCLDHAALKDLGQSGHRELLQWLGTHHARIWCAPVRDIATWQPSR